MADEIIDSLLGSNPEMRDRKGQNLDRNLDMMRARNLRDRKATPPMGGQLLYDLDKRDETSPRIKIEDPTNRLTGSYPKSMLQDIVDSAKQVGIDPLLALSIAGQETTFGSARPQNWSVHNPIRYLEGDSSSRMGLLNKGFSYLKQRMKPYPDDPELAVQAYNGMGVIGGNKMYGMPGAPPAPNFYGKPAGTLTGRKDRPYGKAVLGIRDWLKDSPVMSSLLGDK